ncbi:extracellular ribonuclease [Firmicutes bacterium CAG:345]|nr:extracellular ribonuclease [Firmicutes bacterium CAG:345]
MKKFKTLLSTLILLSLLSACNGTNNSSTTNSSNSSNTTISTSSSTTNSSTTSKDSSSSSTNTSSTNPSSSSTSSSSSSTSSAPINTKDKLKDIVVGNSFNGDVVIAGKRGNDFYVEDQTGYAFVYLNNNSDYKELQIGDQVNLQGKIVEFTNAGIIQISTVTSMTKLKSNCALRSINKVENFDQIDSYRMGRIAIDNVVLESKTINSGSTDSSLKISKNGKTLTIFIGKRLDSQVKNDIESIFNTLNTKDTFSINGAFADYYKSSQIVLTSADQIVADELSFEKKVAIVEANSISSLNNSNVYKDISLPTSGLYNSKIEWTSSNTLVVSNSGKVTRPENGDVKVTLSYVITIDNQKTTSKNITVNVKQKGNTNYEYVYVEPNYSGTYYNQISDELRGKDLLLQLDNLLDSTSHPTINFTYKGLMSEVFPYTDGKDGKLYAFYRGTLASSGSMNREHVWPNSRGGNYVERDPHMVRPTLTSDNSGRGNAFYNESGNYDPGEFGAYQYRGICARIIFYCAVKAQENGLNLVDKNTDSTSNKSMGKLSTLLKWNLEYDIDATEIQRNDVLYTKFKHNRNPFIDDRNYACKIWGDTNAETRGVCSGNY